MIIMTAIESVCMLWRMVWGMKVLGILPWLGMKNGIVPQDSGMRLFIVSKKTLLHSLNFLYTHSTVVAVGNMSLDSCGLQEGDYVRVCKLQQPSQVPVAGEVWVEPW